jgi:hypothetical protein
MSLRKMPHAILDEIRQLQQKHEFEELRQEKLQMEAKLSAMQSQHVSLSQPQKGSLFVETLKQQNTVLMEQLKHYEDTIKNLEDTQSKLAQANAKLEVDLHDQIEINKSLVQRNTDIVLDTSAKDQQISVLKDQRKCLAKQNAKLKNFLRQTDSCLDALQNQQHILKQQQELMHRNAATAPEGAASSSGCKKRKRNDERDGREAIDVESTQTIEGNKMGKNIDDSDVIPISTTMNEKSNKDKQENHVSDVPNSANSSKS